MKPKMDATEMLISDLAAGYYASIDLDGKTDMDGVAQIKAHLAVMRNWKVIHPVAFYTGTAAAA